jgi:diguanylate cyclase (GGDEF)-like protein/PAS domain S-box-containing protein
MTSSAHAGSGSPDRYRAIVEAQSELISLARPDGTLVYVNPAYARHFGFAPQQMVGRCLFEFVQAADVAAVRSVFDQVLAGGPAISSENRMVDAAGRVYGVVWTNGVQHEDGEVLLYSVGHDVTGRKALEQEILDREAFVRMITDSLPLRVAYVDRDLRFRFVNLAHCRRFGRPREEILGRTREELLGRPTAPDIAAHTRSALAGAVQRFEYDETSDGTHKRLDIQLIPDIAPGGEVRGFFYIGLDITERFDAEQALRTLTLEAQSQSDVLRLVTEAIPATVVVVGADTRYRFVNGAFERYCGLPRERILGRTAGEVLGNEEVARRRPFMQRALRGESVTFALDYVRPEGTTWLELTCIPLRSDGHLVDGFVGIAQDITSQRREQARLTELSQREPLTGLLNRAGFEHALERLAGEGLGDTLALMYIDLDRFKPVNDQHGHAVGDHLLQAVAQRLGGLVRPSDAVARLGGDEFVILLAGVATIATAETIAEKVVTALATPFDVDGQRLHIGASVGVAFGVAAGGDWRELIRRADAALYRAKASGRGRHAR